MAGQGDPTEGATRARVERTVCGPFTLEALLEFAPERPTPFESPIEVQLAELVVRGAPLGLAVRFYLVDSFATLVDALGREGTEMVRGGVIAVPQIALPPYRVDLLLVLNTPASGSYRLPPGYQAIAIESDGEDYHGADRLVEDRRRNREIMARYDVRTLRLSGAEIVGRSTIVTEVVGLYVETRLRIDRIYQLRAAGYSNSLAGCSKDAEELSAALEVLQTRLDRLERALDHASVRPRLDREALRMTLRGGTTLGDDGLYGHLQDRQPQHIGDILGRLTPRYVPEET